MGVGSITPFFSILSDPSIIKSNVYLKWAYTTFDFASPEQFLFWMGVAVVLFLFINNAVRALISYVSHRYSAMRLHFIAIRLLKRYLSQPYSFFLDKNSSELSKNILGEVTTYVHRVLSIFLKLITNIIVSLSLLLLLLVVDPVICIVTSLVLGLAYVVIYSLVKSYLSTKGDERARANSAKYRVISEVFGGIKDVKIRNKEAVFVDAFRSPSREYAINDASSDVVAELPRYVMETIAFGGIIFLVVYLIGSGKDFKEVLPLVTLYAFAGYRLLPALQKIFAALTKIKYNLPVIKILVDDFNNLKEQGLKSSSEAPILFKEELRIKDLVFTYPGSDSPVINNQSLTIEANTTVAFVGPTGCGKTTTVDIIMGLLEGDSGVMTVDGKEIESNNKGCWQKNIGYVPQSIFLLDSTIKANIAFGVPEKDIDMDMVKTAAKIANLDHFIEHELENGYNQMVGERGVKLSGGQRQRIGIARALYTNPSVLILDEATSALDNITEKAIMEAIEKLNHQKTIIMIAHRLTTVESCDNIFLMEKGKITDRGTYGELMERNPVFSKMAKGE